MTATATATATATLASSRASARHAFGALLLRDLRVLFKEKWIFVAFDTIGAGERLRLQTFARASKERR